MAATDLKSFSMQGIVGGFLLVCLVSFAVSFMFYNNPTGLGDTNKILENTQTKTTNFLVETPQSADTLLNITSNTNPEVSELGSRDIVATSYSAFGSTRQSFNNAKELISWVFTGTTGQLLLGIIAGVIGLLGYFYITKHIRIGT